MSYEKRKENEKNSHCKQQFTVAHTLVLPVGILIVWWVPDYYVCALLSFYTCLHCMAQWTIVDWFKIAHPDGNDFDEESISQVQYMAPPSQIWRLSSCV